MAIAIIILCLIVAFLFVYAIVLRPWLQKQPWAVKFFAWIDPLELALFKKSEQVLAGRLVWLGGLIVTAYDAVGAYWSNLDFTPITTRVLDFLHVPPDLRGLTLSAFVTALGLMIVNLRKKVTKPLELVAVSDKDVAANPKVAEAIAMADKTKTEAVNVVADAKAG